MKLIPGHTKAARALLNMTQAQLGQAAGVDENTIRYFESGRTVPREETLSKIKDALERRGIIFHNGDKPGVILDKSQATIPV